MGSELKYRDIVREIAFDNYGYVTTKQAIEAGVPAVELPKLAARGGLDSVAYGLYRVPYVPPTVYDQFAEALLRVGNDAYLHGESVLALFGLADVNPQKIQVAVDRRARPNLPPFVELKQVKERADVVQYEGLASQPIAEAILECRGQIEKIRLKEAAKQARDEGLLSSKELQHVKRGIENDVRRRT